MELSVLDLEKLTKIYGIVKQASDEIQAITGYPADLRLHDTPPVKSKYIGETLAEKVIEMVAGEFAVSIEALKSKSRSKPLPDARGVAMIAIQDFTSLSLNSIGFLFGGRDHSTVLTRIRTVKQLAKKEGNLNYQINKILNATKMLTTYDEPGSNTTT